MSNDPLNHMLTSNRVASDQKLFVIMENRKVNLDGQLTPRPPRLLPPVPNLYTDMDKTQTDHYLSKVINMDNQFIKLATNDVELIKNMKATIEYQ